ncbi:MAG: CpsB/CapC family capsule biosynthesis tyrosine phosphatase [Pirellulales bacterium]
MTISFVDIHCHLLPGIDDGPRDWDESLAMARLAAEDGMTTIIATPHQLGSFSHNRGDDIRARVTELQQRLDSAAIPLRVLPGGEARIEPDMSDGVVRGEVLSLGNHRRHVLIELPHDIYLPLESVLDDFSRRKMVVILAHPERNRGLQRRPELLAPLVDAGCLTQITASSLCGTFGPDAKELAEWLLEVGLVHTVASDGHGSRSRRPLIRRAHQRLESLIDRQTADDLCCHNPARIADGKRVSPGRRAPVQPQPRRQWSAGGVPV